MLAWRLTCASGPGAAGRYAPAGGAGMLLLAFVFAIALTGAPSRDLAAPFQQAAATDRAAAGSYAKLPVSFMPNRGQVDPQDRYYAQGGGYSFSFTDDKAVISLTKGKRTQSLALAFVGANPSPRIEPLERAPGEVNYLTGKVHQTHIPTYGVLAYRDLWPGIDMVFKGRNGKLIYEFLLAPSADPNDIRLAWQGGSGLALARSGALQIKTSDGLLTDEHPRSYQRIGDRRVPVHSAFALTGGNAFGFSLGYYDRSAPLVIDPSLQYSTYLGGLGDDSGTSIALDDSGSVYVTGETASSDFPTTAGASDASLDGNANAFVSKLTPDGTELEYSTYLGGSGDIDTGLAIAVDGQGSAYVGGQADSADFPTTPGAYDRLFSCSQFGYGDGFVAKLSPDGSSLVYSTFLGGCGFDTVRGLAVDANGNAYVDGNTLAVDFPTTLGAYDPTYDPGNSPNGYGDGFVTKLNASGSALIYSTFLGGSADEIGNDIAVDSQGSAYVTGVTGSANFPATPGAYSESLSGSWDLFVTKLSPGGSALEYSTFLGGSGTEYPPSVAVDGQHRAYVAGGTYSDDFPTTFDAYAPYDPSPRDDAFPSNSEDAFVTRLSADGSSLSYSTYLGGSSPDQVQGIAVDGQDNAYVVGRTASSNFPTTEGAAFEADPSHSAYDDDAFLSKLSADGSFLSYSTYLGGRTSSVYPDDEANAIAVDGAENAYVGGATASNDFPTTEGAYDRSRNDPPGQYRSDAFVTKLATADSELFTGRLIVKKDADPNAGQDFSFTAGAGLSPSTFQLDDDSAPTLSNIQVFNSLVSGTYSISEVTPPGDWQQTGATCDDGSAPSAIQISPKEVVVCTFVNELLGGYARPISATPLDIRLVPTFKPCAGSANASHQPPLSLPSCYPAAQTSNYLTFNAPDRPAPYSSPVIGGGSLQMKVFCTDGRNPPCPAQGDQIDVHLVGSITGIRCLGVSGGCSAAGEAYSGKVLFKIPYRLTDRFNGRSLKQPGTVTEDFTVLRAGAECSSGNCNLDTTAESVLPYPVQEGKRAVWQLNDIEVLDGGQDGDFDSPPDCPPTCYPNDDEAVFLRQGLFVP